MCSLKKYGIIKIKFIILNSIKIDFLVCYSFKYVDKKFELLKIGF